LESVYIYSEFDSPDTCGACHDGIYLDWKRSLMSISYTHEWNEIEYFQLALPHSLKLDEIANVKSDCIVCHSPLAFLAGDIPPARPSQDSRANEGISCEICHSISGSTNDRPFNFSCILDVGGPKYGPRLDAESSYHESLYSDFTISSELCATCHDEQNPYGAWVKETYREWLDGPCSVDGTRCQDCHMSVEPGNSAIDGPDRPDIARHVFQGAHSTDMLDEAVNITLDLNRQYARAGQPVVVTVELESNLRGHCFPSGSSEERMLWLEVRVTDPIGNTTLIPVDEKGFEGEEYTIADSSAMAYQDLGRILGIPGFKGLPRDGDVPDGARIFRRPYFNPEGEMTICQWHTEDNTLVDYRFAPEQVLTETFTWTVPDGYSFGRLEFEAQILYALLPSSVGEFFQLPEKEYESTVINRQTFSMDIVDWGN